MIFKAYTHCKRPVTAILLVLLAGIVVYTSTFHVPFVFDDEDAIITNHFIKNLDNFYANSSGYKIDNPNRIVADLTLALNYHFGEFDLTGYHLVNLIIHLSSALLVFVLLRLTFLTPYFQRAVKGSVSGRRNSAAESSAFSLQPSVFIPLFAALLFVIHPIQTQAVTYIVQRVTSLVTMFYLLSVVLYVKARLSLENSGGRRGESEGKTQAADIARWVKPGLLLAGAVFAAVLAMKTKEISFTLPLAIVLYEVFFFRGAWKRRLLYLLPLLATLPIIPMTVMDFGGPAGDSVSDIKESVDEIFSDSGKQLRANTTMPRSVYLFTQFRVIVTYLRLLVLPVNQNLDYDYAVSTSFFTGQVLLSFLLLTAIFALAVYLFWRTRSSSLHIPGLDSGLTAQSQPILSTACLRLVSFGIFWFFLTLAVESSFIPIKDVIMEHRLYLPSFGAAAAFAATFYLMAGKLARPVSAKFLVLGATLLVLVLGFATYQRNHVWGDAVRLWQDAAAKSPNKARPTHNLGIELDYVGMRAEAIKALTRAIEIDPYYFQSYYNLADLYLISDQPDRAVPLLQVYILLKPELPKGYVALGAALMRGGQFREAATFLEQNIKRIEDNAEARFYLGSSYAFLGNREAAMRELEVVSRLDAELAATLTGLLGVKSGHGIPHGR